MKKIIQKLRPYLKPFKNHIGWNVFYNILYALFSTLSYVTLLPMMNVLFDKTKRVTIEPIYQDIFHLKSYLENLLYYKVTLFSDSGTPQKSLLLVVSIVIFTFLLKNISGYLASYHMMHLRNGVTAKLRNVMYKKVISLPVSFYSEKRKGDVMARMLGDVGEVQNSFFMLLELIVKEPFTIIFSIAMMFVYSWKLTLFVFIFIPISGLIISRVGKSLKSQSLRAQNEGGYMISLVEETLTGLKVVKSYNAEPVFKNKFASSIDRLLNLSNKIGKKNNLAGPLSEVMGIITIAILLFYGGTLVLEDKTLDGAIFLVFMGLAYNILTPAKAISKASYAVKNGIAAADRVFEILEQENTIDTKENALVKNTFENEISIENINFRYGDENVLKNFSIKVPKGKTVALVGQSGSGKSTIANLLTRFYDVNEGSIKIDGTDIKDWDIHSLRSLMGLVTQDSILFNDTIKQNILIGKPDATDEEIIEALKIANAYEFVKDLPLGIETNIGDAGGKLSGGQKQRLSIARAVLKNPPIMILDEATSALDTESEKLVQVALENMMQNRTSVVIAHRLSTIQKADTIVVMQKGEIVEQGTHADLLAKEGMYAKLVSMQSFE
ncbi:MAG: antibiotic ABC transporter ATP-binding protein [Flavobacterium sp.]|uniref:ABC transporter ATP-binding protein n=1 Tax=unclassified Flavobacterium TaxID=196869 RepID=UPI000C64A437|nr:MULTISPECIES: ABC transporter ATP-binding protein [unclassified Flavobacterium]MBF01690.1 antibiotic ABC transporter ATP-binding protein [Flavobacterium sp.]MCO6162633.1 ABC transporter ATP-binding protein/permease [Flavobacterium sp. NRK F7]